MRFRKIRFVNKKLSCLFFLLAYISSVIAFIYGCVLSWPEISGLYSTKGLLTAGVIGLAFGLLLIFTFVTGTLFFGPCVRKRGDTNGNEADS